MTGETNSTDFPTVNPIQPASGGGSDAFIAKISADGSSLIYSTYLGGSNTDLPHDIALDPANNAYVVGVTHSSNFPTVNRFQPSFAGGSEDAFVAKINASGSAFVYSTYLGGSQFERGRRELEAWLDSGVLKAYVDVKEGFENIPSTFLRIFTGANTGKQLLKIADPAPGTLVR